MSFLDCVRTAAESGLVKPEKVALAEAEWQAAFDDAIAKGETPDAAKIAAGIASVKAVTKLTGVKRWQKINQLEKSHTLYQKINKATKLKDEANDIMRGVEISYDRNRGLAMRYLENLLEAYRPKWGGLVRPIKNMENIVFEAFGKNTGDQSAKEMAEAITKVFSWMRKRANMEGASINNAEWRLPQRIDRLKVRQFTEEEFIADMKDAGDWGKIEYHGNEVPIGNRDAILREMYRGIVTDGKNRFEAGVATGKANTADKLSEARFFHYATPEDYIQMMAKYGAGNVYDQVIGSIDRMSRDIAMMEHFGPTPQAGYNFMKRALAKRGADLELARGPSKKKSFQKIETEALVNLDDQYKILSGFTVGPEENLPMLWLSNANTFYKAPLLSSVLLSSTPDLAFVKASKAVTGLPTVGFMREYAKQFVANKRAFRQTAIRSGLIADSAISLANGFTKFHGPLEGSQWVQRWADIHYRVGLASHHNQIIKHVYGMETMGHFADNAHLPFDKVEFSPQMSAFGITPDEWDLFRSTAIHVDREGKFLRPVDLIDRTDGKASKNVRTGEKFMDFLLMSMKQAYPEPDVVVRAAAGEAVSSATGRGAALRMVTTFRSFPMTIQMTQLRNIQNLDRGSAIKALSALVLWTTLLGGVSLQMKALASGKDFYDPTDPAFWGAALVQGGSLGLVGDTAYNSIRGGGVKAALTAPVAGFVDSTLRPVYDVVMTGADASGLTEAMGGITKDRPLTKDAVKLAETYGPRTWQFKLLLERYLYDTILEAGDPAAYAEKQRRVYKQAAETGQEMWWAPGEEPRTPKVTKRP